MTKIEHGLDIARSEQRRDQVRNMINNFLESDEGYKSLIVDLDEKVVNEVMHWLFENEDKLRLDVQNGVSADQSEVAKDLINRFKRVIPEKQDDEGGDVLRKFAKEIYQNILDKVFS